MMVNVFGLLEKYNKRFVFASSQMGKYVLLSIWCDEAVGEMYTTTLKGLIVKFWNVCGIESDMEKAHVITDFIKRI